MLISAFLVSPHKIIQARESLIKYTGEESDIVQGNRSKSTSPE